ncbi:four helix bundle protein, partial [bacterium]|nr:four helix bundle protein [bacterium]
MGRIERFEDIEAWKKGRILVKEVYKISCAKSYRSDYSLIDQTKRSSISIMANIAEGFARRTKKEFINFLGIAHASAAELQSHLYVALDQNYISD